MTNINCWEIIQEYGPVTLRTIGQGKKLNFTCRKLRVLHRVALKEIDENYKRCGSYVGAILVKEIPKVDYTRSKPITLVLRTQDGDG